MLPPADLLESPPRRAGHPWLSGILVLALGLGVWSVERVATSGPEPSAPIPTVSAQPSTQEAAATASPFLQLAAFLDDDVGFGLQVVCPPGATGPCPYRLLASQDAGASWQARAEIPLQTNDPVALVPRSAQDIAVIEDDATVVRSTDGGYHWSRRAIEVGEPAPVQPGAVIVRDPSPSSTRFGRTGGLSWLDLDQVQRHPLPTPTPVAINLDYLMPSSAAGADLVLTGLTYKTARTAMSTDGGLTWVESSFATDAAVDWVMPFSAGAGRAFVFVEAGDRSSLYRTDDGGHSWADISATQPDRGWVPYGLVGGEIIAVGDAGQVLIAADDGTRWRAVPGAPVLAQIRPAAPGAPLVGEGRAASLTYLSRDGQRWTDLRLPLS